MTKHIIGGIILCDNSSLSCNDVDMKVCVALVKCPLEAYHIILTLNKRINPGISTSIKHHNMVDVAHMCTLHDTRVDHINYTCTTVVYTVCRLTCCLLGDLTTDS